MSKQITMIGLILFTLINVSYTNTNSMKECENNADYKNGCIKKAYYENKVIWRETPYIDKKENGIAKIYYKSGKIHFEIEYENGKKEGITKEYNEYGDIIKETIYKNGKVKS